MGQEECEDQSEGLFRHVTGVSFEPQERVVGLTLGHHGTNGKDDNLPINCGLSYSINHGTPKTTQMVSSNPNLSTIFTTEFFYYLTFYIFILPLLNFKLPMLCTLLYPQGFAQSTQGR